MNSIDKLKKKCIQTKSYLEIEALWNTVRTINVGKTYKLIIYFIAIIIQEMNIFIFWYILITQIFWDYLF